MNFWQDFLHHLSFVLSYQILEVKVLGRWALMLSLVQDVFLIKLSLCRVLTIFRMWWQTLSTIILLLKLRSSLELSFHDEPLVMLFWWRHTNVLAILVSLSSAHSYSLPLSYLFDLTLSLLYVDLGRVKTVISFDENLVVWSLVLLPLAVFLTLISGPGSAIGLSVRE